MQYETRWLDASDYAPTIHGVPCILDPVDPSDPDDKAQFRQDDGTYKTGSIATLNGLFSAWWRCPFCGARVSNREAVFGGPLCLNACNLPPVPLSHAYDEESQRYMSEHFDRDREFHMRALARLNERR